MPDEYGMNLKPLVDRLNQERRRLGFEPPLMETDIRETLSRFHIDPVEVERFCRAIAAENN